MNAKNHHYTVDIVLISIQLLIKCGISFRGIEKTLELFNNLEKKTPSFTCIRKWLGRIGLYELNREKEYRSDWIFIVDFTLELGKQKALVVLGVSQQHLIEEIIPDGRGVSHADVELLGLEIMDSTTGENIKKKLDEMSLRVKKLGINQQSLTNFQKNQFKVDSELLNFQQHICDYVVTQSSYIQDEKSFLATSDVIESLFGKYKQFSARCPFKEMGHMLLTMCLSTMNLTNTVVKNALEAISFADVEAWLAEVFGQSMLSKRKTLFSELVDDTKTA